MQVYTLDAVDKLIHSYVHDYGGTALTLREGVLGHGTLLLYDGDGRKTIVIREVYLNEWSSGHTVRMYNSMPDKYRKLVG